MKQRNCPNCGAPYDVQLNKCPYCETSYFDMSALDFNDREPFYLKIRYGDVTITQLVRPCFNAITLDYSSNTVDLADRWGQSLSKFTVNHSLKTNISFEAVLDNEGHLCEIMKEVT